MKRVLVGVDSFSDEQFYRICQAVKGWAEVDRVSQSSKPEEYQRKIKLNDILVGWPRPEWVVGTNVELLLIGSSGWDAYQNKGLEESGIMLCSGRGVYTIGVAEHCIAMMFALTRRLQAHFQDKADKIFRRLPPYLEVAGSTACIVGLGEIGTELAKRCSCLGMKVLGIVKDLGRSYVGVDDLFHISSLKECITLSDHVFLTLPGGAENRGLFSREVLAAFRTDAYFYNVSRGTTVDEQALYELLAAGRIAGAGIDVTAMEPLPPDSPLWSLGANVLITGHSAGFTNGFPERLCQLVIRNLENFRDGRLLENQVL